MFSSAIKLPMFGRLYTGCSIIREVLSIALLRGTLAILTKKTRRAMAKVTTGTGDTGYTGLLGEQRVPKYDPRPETFGTVDEATSALGLARALTRDVKVKEIIYTIQQELYLLMGELATPPESYEKMGLRMTVEHV